MIKKLLSLSLIIPLLLCNARGQEVSKPVRVRAAGTPRQIGITIGKASKIQIETLAPRILAMASKFTGLSPKQLFAVSNRIAANLEKSDLEEIKGLAAGAQVSYRLVLFLNTFYSVVYDGPACRES
jgi:hypothetical protein